MSSQSEAIPQYLCPNCRADWDLAQVCDELKDMGGCPDCRPQCESCEGYDDVVLYDEGPNLCTHCTC